MARQTWAALAALYPDNTAGAISPADLRAGLIDTMRPHVTSSAPDASDDETLGFDVGHAWIDTSTSPRSVYECVDASTGEAVWVKRYPQDDDGGATSLGDLDDVDTSGAQDGDALTFDADSSTWVPGAGGSGIPAAQGLVVVQHGDDGNAERPAAAVVLWRGSADPTNAVAGDLWDDDESWDS